MTESEPSFLAATAVFALLFGVAMFSGGLWYEIRYVYCEGAVVTQSWGIASLATAATCGVLWWATRRGAARG